MVSSTSPEVPTAAASAVPHHHKPFRWKKLERISKGVGGELYLAHNLTTREKFVVKEIVMTHSRKEHVRVAFFFFLQHKQPLKNHSLSLKLSAMELQELDLLKSLSHPNIVRYLGIDKDDTYFYIFMEYMITMIIRCLHYHII